MAFAESMLLTVGLQIANLTRGQPILALGAAFYGILQLVVAVSE